MFLLCFQVAELDFWKDTQKESDWKKGTSKSDVSTFRY